jgi:hypothetical protein
VTKNYFYPALGNIRTRLRLGWPELLRRVENWGRESRQGIAIGIIVGFVMAACFSALVLLQALARHSGWLPSVQLSVWQVVVGYFVAFALAGTVVGVFAPILRYRVGAYAAGIIGGVLIYGAVGGVADGFSSGWFRTALILGLVFGPVGYYVHYQVMPQTHSSRIREIASLLALGLVTIIGEIVLASRRS